MACATAPLGVAIIDVKLERIRAGAAVDVLTGDIRYDSGDSDYDVVAGAVDGANDDLQPDDILAITVDETVGAGTKGKGIIVVVTIDEEANP